MSFLNIKEGGGVAFFGDILDILRGSNCLYRGFLFVGPLVVNINLGLVDYSSMIHVIDC